ncbi:MAG: hypothetical protein J5709_09235 [Bacteroidales bacterium]|nr:hypothetical protein [Bacteroidales bacterium]
MREHTKTIAFIKAVTIILVSLTSLQSVAQNAKTLDFNISRTNFVDTVKIKIWDGAAVVPVEINGVVRNLMFDTGATSGFWIGEEEDWMIKSGDSVTTYDSQNVMHKKAILKLPPIKMGNIAIENYPMIVDNAMSQFTCGTIDGGLGFDLIFDKGLSFKIDTKDSLMIVTDRKGFFAKEEKGHKTLKYDSRRPTFFVKFPFSNIRMLFDSGNVGAWFDIPQDLLDRWSRSDQKMKQKVDEMTVLSDTTVLTSAGIFGATFDTIAYRILHLPQVEIGDLIFKDLYISTNTASLKLGTAVMRHASLIIDASKRRFVLLPHDGKTEVVVANKVTKGLSFRPAEEGDTLGVAIAIVKKGLEAEKKGIRSGDYLISVDGIPITDFCTYKLRETQGDVTHFVLRSPDGEIKEVDL